LGYCGSRFSEVTASSLSLPLSTCAFAELRVMKAAGTWLPTTSVTAAPAPLSLRVAAGLATAALTSTLSQV